MRRFLKRLLLTLLVLVLAFAGLIGYLMATTIGPRASAGWSRLADMPGPRGEVAAAVGARADDCPREPCGPLRLFVIGGLTGLGRTVATVNMYDPEGERWTRAPDLPQGRHHPGAAGVAGTIYVSGGSRRATDWSPERTMWSLSPTSLRWEVAPEMPEGRMGHQMASIAGTLYVIGGRGQTSNVLIYDAPSRRWSTGAQMPDKRDHLGIAVVGNKIYAIGGRDSRLRTRVDVYDVARDEWSEGPALPVPMSAMATGVLTDGIHVACGEDPATFGGGVIDRHYRLPPGGTEWIEAAIPILPTHGAGGAALNGRFVIAGGARRQGSLSPLGWTGLTQSFAG